MSSYLANLVLRTFEPNATVRPRLAPLFGQPPSDPDWSTKMHLEESVEEQTTSIAPHVPITSDPRPIQPEVHALVPETASDPPPSNRALNVPGNEPKAKLKPDPSVSRIRQQDSLNKRASDEAADEKSPMKFPDTAPHLVSQLRDHDDHSSPPNRGSLVPEILEGASEPVSLEKIMPRSAYEEPIELELRPNKSDELPHEVRLPTRTSSTDTGTHKSDLEFYYSKSRAQTRSNRELHSTVPHLSSEHQVLAQNQVSPASDSLPRILRSWREVQSAPPAKTESTIQVTIGRIEVRAVPQPPSAAIPRQHPSGLSLEEYLRRRSGQIRP